MLINDRLSTILPTVGAFRRRSMQVKWLSCKGLYFFMISPLPYNKGGTLNTAVASKTGNDSQPAILLFLIINNLVIGRGWNRL